MECGFECNVLISCNVLRYVNGNCQLGIKRVFTFLLLTLFYCSKGTFCGRGYSSTEDGIYDIEIYWNGILSINKMKYFVLREYDC